MVKLKSLIKKTTAPQHMCSMQWHKTNAHCFRWDIMHIKSQTKKDYCHFSSKMVREEIKYNDTWNYGVENIYNRQMEVQTEKKNTKISNNRAVLLSRVLRVGLQSNSMRTWPSLRVLQRISICVNWSVSLEYTKNRAMDENTVLEDQSPRISHCQQGFPTP